MIIPHEIKSLSVTLRRLEEKDADIIAILANDWEVARWTASLPYPYSTDDAHQWLAYLKKHDKDLAYGVWKKNSLCGCVSCNIITNEVGYWIGRKYWGKNCATDSLNLLSNIIQTADKTKVLWGASLSDNHRSIRVLEKCFYRADGSVKISGRIRYNGLTLQKFSRQPMVASI